MAQDDDDDDDDGDDELLVRKNNIEGGGCEKESCADGRTCLGGGRESKVTKRMVLQQFARGVIEMAVVGGGLLIMVLFMYGDCKSCSPFHLTWREDWN